MTRITNQTRGTVLADAAEIARNPWVQFKGLMGRSTLPQGSGLGTRISRALAGQLGGSLDAAPARPGGNRPGLRWIMRFPAA